MSELLLFRLQRLTAAILAVAVAGHLVGIVVFSHRGLSAAAIAARLQATWIWPVLYAVFAVAAATHAAIGLRTIVRESLPPTGRFAHRRHLAWWAFAAHRSTGLVLALFLVLHFVFLALLPAAALFDALLALTRSPLLRFGETVLVGALALHLAGGLRLLAQEALAWDGAGRGWAKARIVAAFGFSAAVALIFFVGSAP